MFLIKDTIPGLGTIQIPKKLLFFCIVALDIADGYTEIFPHLVDMLQMLICIDKYRPHNSKHTNTDQHICRIQTIICHIQ